MLRKLSAGLIALVLLLALILGPVAPSTSVASPVFDGMHGLLCPSAHAGSSAT